MGSTATAIRLQEDEVLAEVPPERRFDSYGNDRNLLENRIIDAAFRELRGADIYDNPGKITPVTPEELAHAAMYSVDSSHYTPIVPLMEKSDYEVTSKTITITLNSDEWSDYMKSYAAQEVLIRKVEEINPELKDLIIQVSVQLTDTEKKAWRIRKSEGWKLSSTIASDTSGGKTKSVFSLVVDGKTLPEGYETQALARAAGMVLMKDNLDINEVKVIAKNVREDGSDLVSLTREVKSATAKVVVSYVKVNKDKPASDGYLVLVRHRD